MGTAMIHVFKNPETLLPALADLVVEQAKRCIQQQGRFSFVLSGGGSPKKLYELLASDSYREKVEWKNVFFFFGDERYVPADHPDSNFLMAKKALFDPLNITAAQIFRMNTDLTPATAAQAYERDLLAYFSGEPALSADRPVRFDLVLLGLGDNSHTASLFPHTSVLHEKDALVKEIYVDEVKMFRITLTAPCINQAARAVFLVYGASKAEAVHHILEDAQNIDEYPAQLIRLQNGELHWFLDEGAATGLKAI
jgi:6-phosphogluconolactonase